MQKTTNYQLNQWAKSDRILMDDFNADNQKIDAALAGMPKMTLGTYIGNGTKGQSHPTSLTLPFTPQFLAVFPPTGGCRLLCPCGASGSNTSPNGHSYGNVNVVWNGCTVSWYTTDSGADADYQMNRINAQYIYWAVG